MGRPDGSIPQIVYPEIELINRRRWRHSQKCHFTPVDLTEDSVVMLVDPELPRALWSIGRVIKVHPSSDGHIRSADMRIKDCVYTRPVARLVVLPAIPDSEVGHNPSASAPPL